MSAIQDTAYPRFRTDLTQHELDTVFTPMSEEMNWASWQVKNPMQRYHLLLHLKAYQKLGYFLSSSELPDDLVHHIARSMGLRKAPTKAQLRQ